jgi:hypothetical protein
MRALAILVLGAIALAMLGTGACLTKRASQPNPVNGPVRVLSGVAR